MPDILTDSTDIRRFSNAMRLQSERRIEELTQRLIDGDIDLATWQESMKAELRQGNHEQFVIGKGGDKKLIQGREYLQLGPELKRQYAYLERFAKEIAQRVADGKSLQFAIERAKLYSRSTQAMMWKSAIPVKLPQVPRDGKTQCRTNCKCRLDYKYERGDEGQITAVLVFWKLRPAEHCEDCIKLARSWNPKRFPTSGKEGAPIEQSIELLVMAEQWYDDAPLLREIWGVNDAVSFIAQ